MQVIGSILALTIWAYGIVNADTAWRFVPVVGTVVGAVCLIEDYAPAKNKKQ
jgi:hypothetical protein